MIVPITVNISGRAEPEGEINTDTGVYVNRIDKPAFIRLFRAYGLREEALTRVEELGCKTIVFEVYSTKSRTGPVLFVLSVPFEKFKNTAMRKKFYTPDFRYYLAVQYWNLEGPGQIPSDFFREEKRFS